MTGRRIIFYSLDYCYTEGKASYKDVDKDDNQQRVVLSICHGKFATQRRLEGMGFVENLTITILGSFREWVEIAFTAISLARAFALSFWDAPGGAERYFLGSCLTP